jgi:hypothetical protein
MKPGVILIGVLAFLSSCTNSTTGGNNKAFDSGAIFYDYKVRGEEGEDSVTVLLQYHAGNEESPSIVLDGGSNVLLDGKEIKPDSAKLTGVYYEAVLPAANFKGTHSIVFTDKKGTSHRQQFSFVPFSLVAELPLRIKKEPFVIRLSGLGPESARLRLVMIDTAFTSRDVNEELNVENGELLITTKMWRSLDAGPITLEIHREEEVPLKRAGKEEGRLVITYSLKREFEAIEK